MVGAARVAVGLAAVLAALKAAVVAVMATATAVMVVAVREAVATMAVAAAARAAAVLAAYLNTEARDATRRRASWTNPLSVLHRRCQEARQRPQSATRCVRLVVEVAAHCAPLSARSSAVCVAGAA